MKGTVIFDEISALTPLLEGYESVLVVFDENVCAFAHKVVGQIPAEKFCGEMSLGLSEERKTLETVGRVCRFLLSREADRHSLVLAIGGGITSDVVGFAASVYERGIDCAYIPTTMLSDVDASVGGKTGVNLDSYKNMVGTFSLPVFTLISLEPLMTLPRREFLCGAVEAVKSFVIAAPEFYITSIDFLEKYSSNRAAASDPYVLEMIKASVAVKKGIVERDFRESGERKKLNLGHTFAHAIEKVSNNAIPHGEAVSMGIVLAAELSKRRGLSTRDFRSDFLRAGLATQCPYSLEQLKKAMHHDKKASHSGRADFVLIRNLGDVLVENLEIDRI